MEKQILKFPREEVIVPRVLFHPGWVPRQLLIVMFK